MDVTLNVFPPISTVPGIFTFLVFLLFTAATDTDDAPVTLCRKEPALCTVSFFIMMVKAFVTVPL